VGLARRSRGWALWFRLGLLTMSLVMVPVFWRAYGLVEFGFSPRLFDLRGFWLDLMVSLWALLLVLLFAKRRRPWGLVLILLWSVLYYGSYQNLLALQAFPNLSNLIYLGDSTFIAGSVAGASDLLPALVILLSSLGLAWWGMGGKLKGLHFGVVASGALIALVVVPVWSIRPSGEEWRQTNPLSEAVVASYLMAARTFEQDRSAADLSVGKLSVAHQALVESAFQTDLKGKVLVKAPSGAKPNVLLVIIEGLSGAYLGTIRAHHGAPGDMDLPYLDTLHRKHYSVPNFIVHQRQTNRGLYTILAGRLPNLLSLTPKLSSTAQRPGQRYLPGLLRQAGYRTVFMQATDMGFMMMDQFMGPAGFDESYSDQDYGEAILRTGWGVDDQTLLNQAGLRIAELEKGSKPWFLTLLTCGSHHPYNKLVPAGFTQLPGETKQSRAFRYADQALKGLLDRLAKTGVLDHTLVLITSDEAAGNMASTNTIDRKMSSNWGHLVVRLPRARQYKVDDAFGQADIALSVMDYLGLKAGIRHFGGRSFFRDYTKNRSLFFANNSTRTLGMFGADGELHVVSEALGGASFSARFDPQRIFAFTSLEKPHDYREMLVTLGLRLFKDQVESKEEATTITLAQGNYEFERARQKNFQWVFGGQYLRFQCDTVLEFQVELTIHTDPQNKVCLQTEFHHHSPDPKKRKLETTKFSRELTTGQRLVYRVTYRTGGDTGAIELNQYVKTAMDVPVRIEFSKALVKTMPFAQYGGPTPPSRMAVYSIK